MKKSLFSLFSFVISFNFCLAQTITIGAGTNNSLYGPIYIYSSTSANTHSWNLSIYQQSEIIANGGIAGMFTGISWYKSDTGAYLANDANFEIYLKTTSLTDFSGGAGNFDIESVGATLVFSSSTAGLPASAGWVDFPFSNPFNWNGTDNIMVLTKWMRPGAGTSEVMWACESLSPARVSHSFNSSATMGSLYTTANRPNIRIEIGTSVGTINLNAKEGFQLFPNPASEDVIIQFSEAFIYCKIEILNAMGQIVSSEIANKKSKLLDLNSFAKGIYLVKVQKENYTEIKKLIVK